MIRLGPGFNRRAFDLDKVADMRTLADLRAGPQTGERTDRRPGTDPRPFQV
jgi:hypothetical protein